MQLQTAAVLLLLCWQLWAATVFMLAWLQQSLLACMRSQEPWEAVRGEMIDEKGLPPPVADRIGEFVVHRSVLHLSRAFVSEL